MAKATKAAQKRAATTPSKRRHAALPKGATVVAAAPKQLDLEGAIAEAQVVVNDPLALCEADKPTVTYEAAADTVDEDGQQHLNDDRVYIRITKLIPLDKARAWALYYQPKFGSPIELVRNGKVVARFDSTTRDESNLLGEYVSFKHPWSNEKDEPGQAREAASGNGKAAQGNGKAEPSKPATGSAVAHKSAAADASTGKSATIIRMLKQKDGAAMADMKHVTGWSFGKSYLVRLANKAKLPLRDLGGDRWALCSD